MNTLHPNPICERHGMMTDLVSPLYSAEDNLRQLHGIQESIQRMRQVSVQTLRLQQVIYYTSKYGDVEILFCTRKKDAITNCETIKCRRTRKVKDQSLKTTILFSNSIFLASHVARGRWMVS